MTSQILSHARGRTVHIVCGRPSVEPENVTEAEAGWYDSSTCERAGTHASRSLGRNKVKTSRLTFIIAPLITWAILACRVAAEDAPAYGPAKGTLVIVGGGNAEGTGIMERFIQLGGGPADGKFVIVPTAAGNRNRDGTDK